MSMVYNAGYEPAHTCEHILNETMVRMFGCPISRNARIERKKSKCDYLLDSCPTDEQVNKVPPRLSELSASATMMTEPASVST